ncbi:hypothetical protein JL720_1654 [Aureococcus anophagefferens]|nr:hypothetical protein JL720_1654 [Aureococcus anophagefferens]
MADASTPLMPPGEGVAAAVSASVGAAAQRKPWYLQPIFLCCACCGVVAVVAGVVVFLMLFSEGSDDDWTNPLDDNMSNYVSPLQNDTSAFDGSYMIVMHWNGTLRSVTPTSSLDDGYQSTHMDALKLTGPDTILTYTNNWLEEKGYPYECSSRTRRAIISCRLSDSIVNYNMLTDRVEWVAGGENGTFTITDGTVTLAAGLSYWAGQHNVEYVGDDTYLMFDNAYNLYSPSRILSVVINETTQVAFVDFSYSPLNAYPRATARRSATTTASVQEPPDVLVAGALDPDLDVMFDAQIQEVTPAQEVAWELSIYGGSDCSDTASYSCIRSINQGWKIYSVERFYDSPVVYNATFFNGTLEFLAHSSFKLSHRTTGRWDPLYEDRIVAAGEVVFDAYWKPSTVLAETTWGRNDSAVRYRNVGLVVTDVWERTTHVDVEFTPPHGYFT